jgi:hypothetical protein
MQSPSYRSPGLASSDRARDVVEQNAERRRIGPGCGRAHFLFLVRCANSSPWQTLWPNSVANFGDQQTNTMPRRQAWVAAGVYGDASRTSCERKVTRRSHCRACSSGGAAILEVSKVSPNAACLLAGSTVSKSGGRAAAQRHQQTKSNISRDLSGIRSPSKRTASAHRTLSDPIACRLERSQGHTTFRILDGPGHRLAILSLMHCAQD